MFKMWGDLMERVYESNEIREFEIKILASGNCKCFIPMSFVKIKGQLSVTYHIDGYKELKINQINNPYEMLNVVEKLVLCIKEAQNHLILQSRYCLMENLIFSNQNMSNIKIMFMPIKELDSNETFACKFVVFLKQMCFKDKRCNEYINIVIDKLENFNLSMRDFVNYLGELKREVYLCGWG